MNKLFNASVFMMLIGGALLFSSGCKKDDDEGRLPNISFNTTNGYTATSTTVAKNTAVKVGINASKAEDNDVLTVFNITSSIGGGADSTVYSENLSGASGDIYSKDYSFTTPNQATTEKLTFTVVNKDGIKNSVSLTLTVQ